MNTFTTQVGRAQAPRLRDEPRLTPRQPQPTQTDLIRARAFQLYQARKANNTPGDQLSDWTQAEREVRGKNDDVTQARASVRGETLLRDND